MSGYISKERRALYEEAKKNGRPSKFSPEICEAILHAVSKHVPYEIAATANGISERTFYEWLEIGDMDRDHGIDSDYAKFSQSIKATEQKKIIEHTEALEQSPERWQSKGWLLERRWWKHYGQNAPLVEMNKRLDEMAAMFKGAEDEKA